MIHVGLNDWIGPWVAHRTGGKWYGQGETIGITSANGILCGGVIVENYNGTSASMHVAGEGRWLNREFLFVVFDYVFRQLDLKVVMGFVASTNNKARRFDEHLGFKEVARIPDAAPGGDLIVYAMKKQDCRYWRKHGKSIGTAAT